MLTTIIALTLAGAADPAVLMKRASTRIARRAWSLPAGTAAPRLADDAADVAPTTKDRALDEDGTRCAVVGGRLCTRTPRTVVTTDF